MTGGGGPGPGLEPAHLSGNFSEAASSISSTTTNWLTSGFTQGMVLSINGDPGWTITGVSATTLTLSGPTLAVASSIALTLLGFAPSPLVVYGDTSQDGLWYSGDPSTQSQQNFGSKPFPNEVGNGTNDFIFPVADPFAFFGNNVIDASQDFSTVPEGQLPSVGVIIYGGPGNNTIYGSQAPDYIAGGSGNSTIYGEGGDNQLLGNDGINVDFITRAISFPTVNTSTFTDHDPLLCSQSPAPECNTTIYGNAPGAGEVTTDRFGDYNNVIFGAKGIVTQDTQEAIVGLQSPVKTITGVTLTSTGNDSPATLTCATACFNSATDNGLLVSDSYGYIGAGVTLTVISPTQALLSANGLNGASTTNLTVMLFAPQKLTVNLTNNVAANSVAPPAPLSLLGEGQVATVTGAAGSFNQSDVNLSVSDAGGNISAGTVITWVSADGSEAVLSRNAKASVTALTLLIAPAQGYCRPAGTVPSGVNGEYCKASGTTPWGDPVQEKLQTTGDIYTISSTVPLDHGNDTLYGSGGDNVIIGGDGNNAIQGGPGRNLIIGGSVLLDRTTHLFNYTNPRFQDLSGTAIYNTAPQTITCTSAGVCTASGTQLGQAMNNGSPQCDPTGSAWWGDFLSTSTAPAGTPGAPNCNAAPSTNPGTIGITLSEPLGTAGVPLFLQDSGAKGADYIAGGSGDAMIFGESGNNIIQAHGSIDIVDPLTGLAPASNSETSGDPYAGAATCPFQGYYLGDRVGSCRTTGPTDQLPVDPSAPLQLNPSRDNYGPNYSWQGTFTLATITSGTNTLYTLTLALGTYWADSGFSKGQTVSALVGGVLTEIGVVTAVSGNVLTLTGSPTAVTGCTAASCKLVVTDGESYVEGGTGDNVIFGNQGQNDLIGGNSDMFSRPSYLERASAQNMIFGGSGADVGYGDCTNATADSLVTGNECITSLDGYAHDANVIVANNGDVVRLVGAGSGYAAAGGLTSPLGYLEYNYDVYGYPTATERIIARAVTLLDNTPGGPDLAGEVPGGANCGTTVTCGPLVTGAKSVNGHYDIGGTPIPAGWDGNGQAAGTLQAGSEIHAESGNAFIYGGPADDTIFGGAQDDTIILGYGDNWVSGGRGNQCIIGGGGRCLISRNGYSEPLNGVNSAIPANQLNELITTPGNAQSAVINVAGALNFNALLYPYVWDPATYLSPGISNGNPTYSTNCKENAVCPTYETVYGHNIIYGGWGNGVIQAGPGDSALSGAEAPTLSYADNFDMYGGKTPTLDRQNQATYMSTGVASENVLDYVLNTVPIETDFFHPVNPGNAAGYMPYSDPPNGNQGRGYNIGKSLYFNAEDPRRQILLFPTVVDPTASTVDGLTPTTGYNSLDCEWAAGMLSLPGQTPACTDALNGATGLPFFMNFNPTDPNLPLDQIWSPNTGVSRGAGDRRQGDLR